MSKVYEIVTEKIIEKLQQGTIPWKKTWNGVDQIPCNLITKKPYNGINRLLLSFSGYEKPYFLTFNQCRSLGGSVNKGEKGHIVTFWKKAETTESKNKPEAEKDYFFLMRYYTVFNVAQCSGIDKKIPQTKTVEHDPIVNCENIIAGYENKPTIEHGFNRACYSPALDMIRLPSLQNFEKSEHYYATMFHELGHSTGHSSRLNREVMNTFGNEKYSKEELVAEITASFLCTVAGIDSITIDNSASYIAEWIKVLQDDKKLIIQASKQAQKACDYILGKKDEVKE